MSKSPLIKITARHKTTNIKAEFEYISLKAAAFHNPDFKDFEVVGYEQITDEDKQQYQKDQDSELMEDELKSREMEEE